MNSPSRQSEYVDNIVYNNYLFNVGLFFECSLLSSRDRNKTKDLSSTAKKYFLQIFYQI